MNEALQPPVYAWNYFVKIIEAPLSCPIHAVGGTDVGIMVKPTGLSKHMFSDGAFGYSRRAAATFDAEVIVIVYVQFHIATVTK